VAVVANDTETAEKPPGLSSEVMSSMLEAAREEAREAAYQEGLQVGRDQAMTELQQSFDEKITHLNHILEGLQRLSEDPDTLFEPMKKLAVHLAEQLVRGELSQSPQTISRLVDNCLRELAASGEKAVIVHLNPEDLEQYKPLIAPFGDSILLRPDATLTRGSVRASLDGSVVEDLIERRVKGIQKSLAQPVAGSWRPALPNPLVQRAQPQSPTPVSKSPVVEEAADTAEDVFSADDDLTDTVLTQSDAAAEPIDTVGASDIAIQGVHGDVEPGATP
jgi:flagellar biosynthesis/type III secretory pathway protein FliH